MKLAAFSHKGFVRERNEDCALVPPALLQSASEDITVREGHFAWLAVADGLGGHARGDLASRTVLSALVGAGQPFHSKEDLNELSAYLGDSLAEEARKSSRARSMATTLTAFHFLEDTMHLIHCGDCRAYDVSHRKLLTVDHTLVFANYLRGEMSLEEVRSHPMKSRLLRCLQAMEGIVEMDLKTMPLQSGRRYLLASDGIWEAMPMEALLELADNEEVEQSARAIQSEYFAAGARDNGTLILFES
ncbi:MAG: serine/threonine-protein phosphatase [Leptospiraceae bacterium]|nr:serine/threonine-protein phosphatase [Leptospiraceae bacterium]